RARHATLEDAEQILVRGEAIDGGNDTKLALAEVPRLGVQILGRRTVPIALVAVTLDAVIAVEPLSGGKRRLFGQRKPLNRLLRANGLGQRKDLEADKHEQDNARRRQHENQEPASTGSPRGELYQSHKSAPAAMPIRSLGRFAPARKCKWHAESW